VPEKGTKHSHNSDIRLIKVSTLAEAIRLGLAKGNV